MSIDAWGHEGERHERGGGVGEEESHDWMFGSDTLVVWEKRGGGASEEMRQGPASYTLSRAYLEIQLHRCCRQLT